MTDAELGYLAGIIDGEGSVSLFTRGSEPAKGYVTPAVQVSNTDKRLIDWLHRTLGGKVYPMKNRHENRRKPVWLWCCFGKVARGVIRDVRPHLLIKGEQADLVLSLPEPRNRGGQRLSDAERAERIAAVARMRELNRRGVAEGQLF